MRVDAEHHATARLTVVNTGQKGCRSGGAPKVEIDSGLGEDQAVDGTAAVMEGYGPDVVIPPGGAFAFPLSQGAAGACGGNHQLPIVRMLVTLPHDRDALSIPGATMPRAARDWCWIDGLSMP